MDNSLSTVVISRQKDKRLDDIIALCTLLSMDVGAFGGHARYLYC